MQALELGAKSRHRPFEILLVEDSPTDVLLATEALSHADVPNHLQVVSDGVAAMAFLHRRAPFAAAPRPDLILLDLNLPKKDGREVLAEIKADPGLREIPVVILTTSKGEEDIRTSYAHHANCYISKPVDFDRFVRIVQEVVIFWFSIVALPPPPKT